MRFSILADGVTKRSDRGYTNANLVDCLQFTGEIPKEVKIEFSDPPLLHAQLLIERSTAER